jgi:hypothetical protein
VEWLKVKALIQAPVPQKKKKKKNQHKKKSLAEWLKVEWSHACLARP